MQNSRVEQISFLRPGLSRNSKKPTNFVCVCLISETWGAQTFCCDEDACNSSDHQTLSLAAWLCSVALVTLRQIASI